MPASYIKDSTFEKLNFQNDQLLYREFENCKFVNCFMSEMDLSNLKFVDCQFSSCNLSLSKLNNTTLFNVTFSDCKMLGLHFEDCNDFGFSIAFDHCQLDYASFYKLKIKKTVFNTCQFKEADFTECDLNHATFTECNLLLARFDHSNLEFADFRTSYNYSINPQLNKLKKAKFSLVGVVGLLDTYDVVVE